MKKFITDIKTLAALLIAGAAFTACSSDDNAIDEQPVNPATQKYTMTVNASKGDDATTRALSLTGSTLNATWDANEKVLVYQNGLPIGTLTAAESSNASTTLSGTLDSAPDANQDLTFYFHTNAKPTYSGQDGTLTKIASTYDFCAPATVATGNFTVDARNKTVSVSDGISFGANQQAIVKFTFKDKADGTTLLSPSAFTVSVDLSAAYKAALQSTNPTLYYALAAQLPYENSLTIPASTYTENGEGIIYLAIPDKVGTAVSDATTATGIKSNLQITITATVGSDTYTLIKSGFPFTNGQYYEITAKMTKQVTVWIQSAFSDGCYVVFNNDDTHVTLTDTGYTYQNDYGEILKCYTATLTAGATTYTVYSPSYGALASDVSVSVGDIVIYSYRDNSWIPKYW